MWDHWGLVLRLVAVLALQAARRPLKHERERALLVCTCSSVAHVSQV